MKLYWLDLETTGLDPQKHQILEVSMAVANLNNPFDIEHLYQAVIPVEPNTVLDPYILNMHTKNGLLAECASSKAKSRTQVDEELANLIEWVENKDERATLAGSSIHFDHSFISVHFPLSNKKLSHRHYDVSALKLFCQSMGAPKFPKAEAHRSRDDINESVAHAAACLAWIKGNLKA